MKTVKAIPSRNVGSVGDKVKFRGRVFHKAGNGKWGIFLSDEVKAEVLRLYSDEGLTLRAVAARLSDDAYTFPMRYVQDIVNENKRMRSHYGARDKKVVFLDTQKKTIFDLFNNEGFSITDLGYVLGVGRGAVASLFNRYRRKHKAGRRPSEERVNWSRRMSTQMVRTWNSILSEDAQQCTYDEYVRRVRRLTELVYRVYRQLDVSERAHCQHLDHVLSIHDGYWERSRGRNVKRTTVVPFSLIAHPKNLRLVDREVNLEKGDKSLHSPEELKRKVARSKVKLEPINRKKELRMIASKYKLRAYEEN